MTSSAPHSDNDHPAEAAPRKRGGRPAGRINYATRCRWLQQRLAHVSELLREAADADPAVCKALLNVALRTLSDEG